MTSSYESVNAALAEQTEAIATLSSELVAEHQQWIAAAQAGDQAQAEAVVAKVQENTNKLNEMTVQLQQNNPSVDNSLPGGQGGEIDNSLPGGQGGSPDNSLPGGQGGSPDQSLPGEQPVIDNSLPGGQGGTPDNSLPGEQPVIDNSLPGDQPVINPLQGRGKGKR